MGATDYIGHRSAGALWRAVDKVIEQQNRTAGTLLELPVEKKRPRVELRLNLLEQKRLGISSMDALMGMNFARLQGTQRFLIAPPT